MEGICQEALAVAGGTVCGVPVAWKVVFSFNESRLYVCSFHAMRNRSADCCPPFRWNATKNVQLGRPSLALPTFSAASSGECRFVVGSQNQVLGSSFCVRACKRIESWHWLTGSDMCQKHSNYKSGSKAHPYIWVKKNRRLVVPEKTSLLAPLARDLVRAARRIAILSDSSDGCKYSASIRW